MRKPSIYRRLVLLAAAALAGMVMAAGAAHAGQRPTIPLQLQHYLECLDWMINNPAKHEKLCAPGHPYIIENPKGGGGSDEPDCEYIPSAFMLTGGYDDCPPPPPPPCYDRTGFVLSTFGDCPEPCKDDVAYILTGGGYGDCDYTPPCGLEGSLKLPEPQAWILEVVEYEGGCATAAPLVYDELRLFAI